MGIRPGSEQHAAQPLGFLFISSVAVASKDHSTAKVHCDGRQNADADRPSEAFGGNVIEAWAEREHASVRVCTGPAHWSVDHIYTNHVANAHSQTAAQVGCRVETMDVPMYACPTDVSMMPGIQYALE